MTESNPRGRNVDGSDVASRTCRKCGAVLRSANNARWMGRLCGDCYRASRRLGNRSPNRMASTRRVLWRSKGIEMTHERYEELRTVQGGACALCGKKEGNGRLQVDHDHKSGRVRGLLCPSCNRALGAFGESQALIQRAIDYLLRARLKRTEAQSLGEASESSRH